MLISVIIPIYNVAPYVEQCIQSVMHQTLTEGVECILVDDCGLDNSMEIVENLIAGYHGKIDFRILRHVHNRGLSAARNTGIDAARGEWIYFLDSDDWITPQCFTEMAAMVKKYPNVQLVQAGAHITEGPQWLSLEKSKYPEYIDDRYLIKTKLLGRYQLPETAWNKLVKRDFVITNALYFEEGLIHEDNLWMNMLAKYVTQLAVLSHDTYEYRIRENSITNDTDANIYRRRLPVESLKIKRIDDLYKKEQVEYILWYETRMYFMCKDSSIRKDICTLHRLLAEKSPISLKIHLYLRYYTSRFNCEDGAWGYRTYSLLCRVYNKRLSWI